MTQKFLPAKDIDGYLQVIEKEEAEEKKKTEKKDQMMI
jgi:hypothetical protein